MKSEAVKQKIHNKTKTLNAILSLTQMLFIAIGFIAVYYGSRRYYVEHLDFALYLVSFLLIVQTALSALGIVFIKITNYVSLPERARHIISREFQFWIPLGVLATYLFFVFRTFYGSSITRAMLGIPFVLAISIATQNILSWIGFLLIISSI